MDDYIRDISGIELRFVSIDTIAVGFDDPDMIAVHLDRNELLDLIIALVSMLNDIDSEV